MKCSQPMLVQGDRNSWVFLNITNSTLILRFGHTKRTNSKSVISNGRTCTTMHISGHWKSLKKND